MNGHRCFIKSMSLVSCQKPLSNDWIDEPCSFDNKFVRASEPDVKGLISPGEARRMSRILRRTIWTSLTALQNAGVNDPDAIITGTGMGCIENSEKFLIDLARFGENCLKPTLFMQSTHNTISSLIAIVLKCHGYNNTYSHTDISFESALLDGWLQIRSGMISNALIGSHDEVTPFMSIVLERTHPEYSFVSETSMSAFITSQHDPDCFCEISDVRILHKAEIWEVAEYINGNYTDLGALMLGSNGNPRNDAPYHALLARLHHAGPILCYKPVFGENFSASAAGLYAAAMVLKTQEIPAFLLNSSYAAANPAAGMSPLHDMLLINSNEDYTWSLIHIKRANL